MTSLEILFEKPDGSEETKVFNTRPLGMEFLKTMPLTVSDARMEARSLGIEQGWVIKEVGGMAVGSMSHGGAMEVLKRAVLPLRADFARRPSDASIVSSATSLAELTKAVGPVEVVEVPCLLQRYGYSADTPRTWEKGARRPTFVIGLAGERVERQGGLKQAQTWYSFQCSLELTRRHHQCWQVERRLSQLRALLNDPFKEELGEVHYGRIFEGAPFPSRISLRAAAGRELDVWLHALANGANNGKLPPKQLARAIRFFEAPEFELQDLKEAASAPQKEPAQPAVAEEPAPAPPATPPQQQQPKVEVEVTLGTLAGWQPGSPISV